MSIGASTRLAAVLGCPVAHSKSPALHNAAFAATGVDAVYLALPVAPEDLGTVVRGLRAIRMLGASVTVPHKTAVVAHCDALSDTARAIGAVNTLEVTEDGQLIGHNTDAPGYVRAFEEETGQPLQGRRVVLLGGGGAARAVACGVETAGVENLQLIARSPEKVEWARAQPWREDVLAAALRDCDVLVDCTSMGLDPARESSLPAPIPLECMPASGVVSTLVYHRETSLLAAAKARGLRTLDGAGMLLYQGAIAFEIWTGLPAPVEAMSRHGLND